MPDWVPVVMFLAAASLAFLPRRKISPIHPAWYFWDKHIVGFRAAFLQREPDGHANADFSKGTWILEVREDWKSHLHLVDEPSSHQNWILWHYEDLSKYYVLKDGQPKSYLIPTYPEALTANKAFMEGLRQVSDRAPFPYLWQGVWLLIVDRRPFGSSYVRSYPTVEWATHTVNEHAKGRGWDIRPELPFVSTAASVAQEYWVINAGKVHSRGTLSTY